ncbi:fimbrial protein [Enterobacter ludwigii]|uniref:fimbrial protein n=1 Tax=Enterobacter ludwigii TaxID=299767 RepID=UPI00307654ED
MAVLSRILTGFTLTGLLCSASVQAASGNSAQLTLTLIMEQSTCDVGLVTPSDISFPALALNLLDEPGHITYAGNQTVTLGLTNCAGSAKSGAVPAIQIQGTNPVTDQPTIFREYASTAGGNLGFGLRYLPDSGTPGPYLTSGDYVDLAAAGEETQNQNMNFQVDMLRGTGGDAPTSGVLLAHIRFQFAYH